MKWMCDEPECTKDFTRKGDLARHMRNHRGLKPFVCEVCKKRFGQSSGLKVHRNVHTKAKPYVCGVGICRKAFGDPSSCSRHRKEYHSNGSYYCYMPRCDKSIKRRSTFKTHLIKAHFTVPTEQDLDAAHCPVPRDTLWKISADVTAEKRPDSATFSGLWAFDESSWPVMGAVDVSLNHGILPVVQPLPAVGDFLSSFNDHGMTATSLLHPDDIYAQNGRYSNHSPASSSPLSILSPSVTPQPILMPSPASIPMSLPGPYYGQTFTGYDQSYTPQQVTATPAFLPAKVADHGRPTSRRRPL